MLTVRVSGGAERHRMSCWERVEEYGRDEKNRTDGKCRRKPTRRQLPFLGMGGSLALFGDGPRPTTACLSASTHTRNHDDLTLVGVNSTRLIVIPLEYPSADTSN